MATVKKIRKYQNAPAPIKRSTVNGEKIREIYEKNKSILDSARNKNINVLDEMNAISKPKLEAVRSKTKDMAKESLKKGGKVTKAKDGKWIQKAIKKPGALRQSLGVKKGESIPASKLAAAAKKPGKMGQRARLAQTLKKMKKK